MTTNEKIQSITYRNGADKQPVEPPMLDEWGCVARIIDGRRYIATQPGCPKHGIANLTWKGVQSYVGQVYLVRRTANGR